MRLALCAIVGMLTFARAGMVRQDAVPTTEVVEKTTTDANGNTVKTVTSTETTTVTNQSSSSDTWGYDWDSFDDEDFWNDNAGLEKSEVCKGKEG